MLGDNTIFLEPAFPSKVDTLDVVEPISAGGGPILAELANRRCLGLVVYPFDGISF